MDNATAATYKVAERGEFGFYGVLILFNKEYFIKQNAIRTIVHESIHAVNMIFEILGCEYDLTNDEFAAYLGGWIGDQCQSLINKLVRTDKKDN